MKIVFVTNWVLIGLYGLFLLFSFTGIGRPGNDAAGRGMESGFVFLGAIVLAVLIVLNFLPYRGTRITALVILALPALGMVAGRMQHYFVLSGQQQDAVARSNGSFFFEDPQRREIAAAVAAGDTERLQTLLNQPVPQLNECGNQGTTLLDFAAFAAMEKADSPQILQCMELLMKKGATLQGPDSVHTPTHHQICSTGSVTLLKWFLDHGADANTTPYESEPILFKVMEYDVDRLEKVKLLLEHGADPNARVPNYGHNWKANYTPLLYAAHEQLWALGLLLLEHGADPARDVSKGRELEATLKRHAELYAESGETPVEFTAFRNKLEALPAKK
ncbi:ankyrin repeat domain-containing protein [Larkinella soli]|uniref:ankyrin repeat domain-containing protein n=1 Tax=Larkinella soli TaxID=1770527 RepID=UPI000FFC25FA|nr:ankyrin repeat domain-containing protein [Larkinella soli]